MWDPQILIIVSAVFLLAGCVKGVIGMGLPVVSVGLLAAFLGPKEAIALMLVPSFLTNVWQSVVGGSFVVLMRRLWTLLLAVCVGVWFGAAVLAAADAVVISGALGLLLCLYAGIGLLTPQVPTPGRREVWLSPVVGAVNGVLTGITGTFAFPGVPYLQALGLPRDVFIQAMGILFTISTVALAVALGGHGLLPAELGLLSTIAIVPAFAGMVGGQWIRRGIPEPLFRKVILVCLLVLGLYLVARAVLVA